MACVIGVVAIFVGNVNQIAFKAMFTSVVLAGGCLLAIACLAAWEQPGATAPSRIGMVCTFAMATLLTGGMWFEPRSETFWKVAGTVSMFAVLGAHGSILWLARLNPRAHWLRSAALVCDLLLAMLILAGIWGGLESDATFKGIAALSIAVGGATVAIAAISTMNRIARPGDSVAEVCFCPRCGKSLWMPAGEVRCRHCDEVFFIELRQQSELPSAIVKS
jgi:hypothetical protein